jgi:hypothetical protein
MLAGLITALYLMLQVRSPHDCVERLFGALRRLLRGHARGSATFATAIPKTVANSESM